MTLGVVFLLFLAGFLSGAVNAVAGGGTFLVFGALTFAGLPPIAANATSSIVQFPGYVTSTLAYKREILRSWESALVLAALSVSGAALGAVILLKLDNASFRLLLPWLLGGATLLFALGPVLRPEVRIEQVSATLPGSLGQFITAIYGGFFGAGMGIMMLAVLGLTAGGGYHHLNALKNLLAMLIAAVAILVFVAGGVVSWPQALIMIPAGAAGGYFGVWLAKRVPRALMRLFVILAGGVLTAYYALSGT